ncbi:hypothetical protein LG634_34080 [Streptomyces bambusae]|uniref:hypothetical protein n=1 Tax=Streptomyces bambusae TaxID=1550616 RepID=UPI001CFFB0BF|nr:hypothetical protein [Streptomyces bambusae]MCB5169817.1 hypothetical protein [Streptomyces bambusae]
MAVRHQSSGGSGGTGCLSLAGFFVAGYMLALPAVLPLLMKPPPDGARPALLLNPWVWLFSLLTAVLLAWMAAGRTSPKERPGLLAAHTALFCAAGAGGAALGAWLGGRLEPKLRRGMSAEDGDFLVSFASGLLEITAAGVLALLVFQGIRSRYAPRQRPYDGPIAVGSGGPRTGTRTAVRIQPRPAEVWLAMVPLRDDPTETLKHYCVIVEAYDSYATVVQITSKDKDHRGDHIRMPNDGWDRTGTPHWLEIGPPPREVPYANFLTRRPQGRCPKVTWREIARQHLSG